ncbi:MAG: PKD domain-containing protein [Acidobacteriota bacterium]
MPSLDSRAAHQQPSAPARRRAPALLLLAALCAAPACVGKYESDFQIIVLNRTANAITVMINGNEVGQVAVNQQGSFTVRLQESNANTFTGGVGPTPQGQVTLTARDVRTGAISLAKSITVSAGNPTHVTFAAADFPPSAPTVARFTVSPNNPGPDQEITFNASASTPNTGTFTWTFGDGARGTGVTTTHRYSQPGAFVVTLTVTSESGQSATATSTVNVSTLLPPQNTVNFTFSPAAPGVDQEVFFNASTSNVPGATFRWDFGDGGTATGVTTTHRFARAGTYTVTLTATTTGGQARSVSRTVSVSATSPQVVASFTFSPVSPGIGQDVFFNASASRPANGTYTWFFGDGTTGGGVTPIHDYDRAGTFTVTLTVTNDIGQSATTTRNVTVTPVSPQVFASFTFSPTQPGIGQEIFFNASASRPTNASFRWIFGDGNSGFGVAPTHRYAQAGTYTVTLVVTNEFGQTATTTRTVIVSPTSAQVVASFTFSPTTPGLDQDVFFNASGSTPVTGTFVWNFGDGRTGTGITPVHRYSQPGTYTVTLTVASNTGQSATTTRTVTVSSATVLVADFTFSPTDPTISRGTNTVIFDATPSSPSAVAWSWDFGDGTPFASGLRTTHTYTLAGTWVVRLTITDALGRTGTTTKTVTVSP